jgi:hypothetical protein
MISSIEAMQRTCRSSISLAAARISIIGDKILIINGCKQKLYLRIEDSIEREKWFDAFKCAKKRAIRLMDSEDGMYHIY